MKSNHCRINNLAWRCPTALRTLGVRGECFQIVRHFNRFNGIQEQINKTPWLVACEWHTSHGHWCMAFPQSPVLATSSCKWPGKTRPFGRNQQNNQRAWCTNQTLEKVHASSGVPLWFCSRKLVICCVEVLLQCMLKSKDVMSIWNCRYIIRKKQLEPITNHRYTFHPFI